MLICLCPITCCIVVIGISLLINREAQVCRATCAVTCFFRLHFFNAVFSFELKLHLFTPVLKNSDSLFLYLLYICSARPSNSAHIGKRTGVSVFTEVYSNHRRPLSSIKFFRIVIQNHLF